MAHENGHRVKKIGLVGAGNIGGILAMLALYRNLGDVVLLDVKEDVAKGKALDLSTSKSVVGFGPKIMGTCDFKDLEGADAVVVTAGVPRSPAMKSRDDLLSINANIISSIAKQLTRYAPNAFVVCVTNPLDAMVVLMQEVSGLPRSHVLGMGGVLDTSRFKLFLSEWLGVSQDNISAFVLGGHGDNMVPLLDYASVSGIPLRTYIRERGLDESELQKIVERTRKGGGEVLKLMGTSAYFSPAAAAMEMVEAFLYNKNKILPSAVYAKGHYGVTDPIYVGLPTLINAHGASEVVDVPLSEVEKKALQTSAGTVSSLRADLVRLGYLS